MTIQYKESSKYKLQADYYEQVVLECTYVEGKTIMSMEVEEAYTEYMTSFKA